MALTNALTLAVSALALLSSPNRLVAQGVSDAMLVHPPPDSWPGYHGDYSGKRHSELAQITPRNVHELSLAWAYPQNGLFIVSASISYGIYFTKPRTTWGWAGTDYGIAERGVLDAIAGQTLFA